MSPHKCETPNCGKDATIKCLTCLELGIEGSYFCTQACLKNYWNEHKFLHSFAEDPWLHYQFTGQLRPFPQTSKRLVPQSIECPDYANHPSGRAISEEVMRQITTIKVLNDDEIDAMRIAGKLGRECLDEAAKAITVGITTDELDRLVHEAAIEHDCYPSPLNYYNFPKSCCTSVNEVICHGIPDIRPLCDSDICNVDVTVYHHGYHGDLNETFFVGNVSEKHKKLVQVTYESLCKAIGIVRPGVKYSEIGNVIEKYVKTHQFNVVKNYCGHGIHHLFHTAPRVYHCADNPAIGVMEAGHCFTIEPMITEGVAENKKWPDKWTVVTADGLYSAQFEQTLLVTENGCEILTRRRENYGQPWFMDSM